MVTQGCPREIRGSGPFCLVTNVNYCTKHNQHVMDANARGSGGMSPRKYRCSGIEFGDIFRVNLLSQSGCTRNVF